MHRKIVEFHKIIEWIDDNGMDLHFMYAKHYKWNKPGLIFFYILCIHDLSIYHFIKKYASIIGLLYNYFSIACKQKVYDFNNILIVSKYIL